MLLPTSIPSPPSHPSSELSLCTLSSKAFCQSLNIIMYVLSRAPKEVKKCWMGREGEKNQLRKSHKTGEEHNKAVWGHFPAGVSHPSSTEWSSHQRVSTGTALLEMCCCKTWIFPLAPHPPSELQPQPKPFSHFGRIPHTLSALPATRVWLQYLFSVSANLDGIGNEPCCLLLGHGADVLQANCQLHQAGKNTRKGRNS